MKYIINIVLISMLTLSCKTKGKIDTFDCTNTTPTYNGTIKTLIDRYCATSGCHSANSKAGKIDLSSYDKVKSAADNDNFLGSIQQKSGYEAMPRGSSKWNDSTIKKISCWVQNGKPL